MIELIDSVKDEATKLKPKLAVILVGENPASLAYIKNKRKACEHSGIEYEERRFPDTITQDQLIDEIEKVNADETINGLIVQLPLPDHIQVPLVIRAIDPKKDVDGFHPINVGRMVIGLPSFVSATPAASSTDKLY